MAAMNALQARAGKYLGDALRGVQRAPVEVIATLCVAITFSWAVELGDEAFGSWAEVAVSCLLLLAVAWTGTLLHAAGIWSETRRWTFTLGGGLVVLLYALTADLQYTGEQWRAALLAGAAVMWLIALPAFAGDGESRVDRMRRMDGRILLRLIGAALYGAALFGGLALALRAIDVLFEMGLDEKIYAHVWGWITFVLIPWIVLGGLADYVRPIGEANAVAGVAHRIALYLVPPLLALYYLILFAYVVRIVVTGEVPKNLVSPMVLAAGGLSALGVLLFDPRPGGAAVFRWMRMTPALFLPLAPLGAWALIVRVQQYGLTEFRVIRLALLGVLVLLAIAASVQLVRRRSFALHGIPLAIAAVLLLSAVGPWSALAISRQSQQTRLNAALARAGIAPEEIRAGAPYPVVSDTAARVVPASVYEQILSSAQYLAGNFGTDALPPVLRNMERPEDRRWIDYAAALGLRPDAPLEQDRAGMGGSLARGAAVELEGGTAYRITARSDVAERDQTGAYALLLDSTTVAVNVSGRILYADAEPLISGLRVRARGAARNDLTAGDAVLPVTDSAGRVQGQLVVWSMWMESDSAGRRLGNLDGLVVIRRQ